MISPAATTPLIPPTILVGFGPTCSLPSQPPYEQTIFVIKEEPRWVHGICGHIPAQFSMLRSAPEAEVPVYAESPADVDRLISEATISALNLALNPRTVLPPLGLSFVEPSVAARAMLGAVYTFWSLGSVNPGEVLITIPPAQSFAFAAFEAALKEMFYSPSDETGQIAEKGLPLKFRLARILSSDGRRLSRILDRLPTDGKQADQCIVGLLQDLIRDKPNLFSERDLKLFCDKGLFSIVWKLLWAGASTQEVKDMARRALAPHYLAKAEALIAREKAEILRRQEKKRDKTGSGSSPSSSPTHVS